MATLTYLNNPFNPNDKTVSQIDGGLAIFLYLDKVPEEIELIVSLNGHITEDYNYILRQSDHIAVVAIPQGGGGGKNPLRTIAMLALTLLAPEVGAWAQGLYQGSAAAAGVGTAFGYAASYAIGYGATMLVGGLLINSLFPVDTISPTSSKLEEISPTYSFSGGSNAREAGSTLPFIIGEARVTPPVIGSYLSLDGEKQYLNVLMAVADGLVDSISGVQVNAQDYTNFDGVTYETRSGTNNQTVIPGFQDSKTTFAVGTGLNTTGSETTYTTIGNAIQELEIVLNFTKGHFKIKDNGEYVLPDTPINYKIEYKKTTDLTYTTFTDTTLNKVYKTTQRLAVVIPELEPDQYDIKITRVSEYSEDSRTANDLQLEYVNEVIYTDFIYPNVALLSVKALATDQLSGGFPTITCIANKTTYTIESTSQTISLDNPAWGCYYLLKKANISDENINLVKFQEWADYCDAEGFTCNLYLDAQQELQTGLNMISTLGRASVPQMGSVFTPIISKVVDIPTQSFLFTSGNIISNSFSLSTLPYNERANIVEVTYYDKNDNYNAKTVQVQSDFFDTSTEEIKASVNLYGCTDRTIALRYAKFLLNQNQYISESVSFEVDIDAVACQVGEVIKVGLKYMGNTLADGRLSGYTVDSLILDKEVQLTQNTTYELQVRDESDDIQIFTYTPIADEVTDTLPITHGLTIENAINIPYAFGEQSSGATDLYRVDSITRADDMKRKITATEYNATVYDDNVTVQLEAVSQIEDVSNITASSFLIKTTDSYEVGVRVQWQGNRISYPIYYKKTSESAFEYYTTTSLTYTTFRGLDYGESYDIKILDKIYTVIFQDDTIPADVDTFNVSGLTRQMKTLSFTMAQKPIDFKGYRIKYQLGNYAEWNTGIPISDSLIEASPYQTELLGAKGTYTLMIKAVDIFGNESANTSNILFEQTLSIYDNLVFSSNFTDWVGEKTNFEINVDGNLEAIADNGDGTYTSTYTDIFYPDVGETAKILFEGDGSPQIYYRTFGDNPFYDGTDMYSPSGEYIYRETVQNTWNLYTTGFKTTPFVPYQVKIEYVNSPIKPIVREFKVEIDARDVLETLDDIQIPSAGLRVYTTDIDTVKWVGGALQDDGGNATYVNYIKYSDGAFIKCYDENKVATAGLVDILIKGYNNG